MLHLHDGLLVLLLYGGKKNLACHNFKMIYTETHYDVEKCTWVFKFGDFSPWLY